MKKRNLFFLLLILFQPFIVQAVTYETAFSEWQETTIPIENNELQEGKKEKKYRFYLEEKEFAPNYRLSEEKSDDYPFQSDRSIITDFSDWSLEEPVFYKERTIETKMKYYYQKATKISSINLYDVNGTDNKLWITEIEVLYQDQKIPYTIECDHCTKEFQEQIQNNQPYESAVFLPQGEELKIDLQQEYDLEDLVFRIYIGDTLKKNLTTYQIGVNDDLSNQYVHVERKYWTISSPGGAHQDEIQLKKYVQEINWDKEIEESEEFLEESQWTRLVETKTYYRYQDVKHLYYRIVRKYLDNYYFEKEGYIKDEEDYVNVYYTRKKDRLILKDNIEITKNYLDLNDIFISSTVPYSNLVIRNNIDWTQPGIYQIQIIYRDLDFSIPVKVNKPEVYQEDPVIEDIKENPSKVTVHEKVISQEEKKLISKNNWKDYVNCRNISLFILFLLGLFLLLYGLHKSVERKK